LERKIVQRGVMDACKVTGLSESMQGLARVYGIETLLENILTGSDVMMVSQKICLALVLVCMVWQLAVHW
jgi:hypothetical protein